MAREETPPTESENGFTFPEEGWNEDYRQTTDGLIAKYEESMQSNRNALALLKEILHDNNQRIRVDDEQLIVRGELATYVLRVPPLIDVFHSVYSTNAMGGFPTVAIHPLGRLIEKPKLTCLQVDAPLEIPSIDSLISLILGLMNDRAMFLQVEHDQLRNRMISLYGYGPSPIQEVLDDYFSTIHNASHQHQSHRFSIAGTDGWTWHIEYDSEIEGFRVLSSLEDGPNREHLPDSGTFYWSLESILQRFQDAPASFKDSIDSYRYYKAEHWPSLERSVAEHWPEYFQQPKDSEIINPPLFKVMVSSSDLHRERNSDADEESE